MKYKNPIPVVDGIIEKNNKILLIKRRDDPFKERLALPGGHVEYGERVEETVLREIEEETGIITEIREILGVYSDPKRDPRKHRMSTVFVLKIIDDTHAKASSDAKSMDFYNIDELKEKDLSFDHYKIIQHYKIWKEHGGTFWSSKEI